MPLDTWSDLDSPNSGTNKSPPIGNYLLDFNKEFFLIFALLIYFSSVIWLFPFYFPF